MWLIVQIKAVFVSLGLLLLVLLPACIVAIPFSLRRRLKIVSPVWAFCAKNLLRHGCYARVLVDEDHRSQEFNSIPPQGLFVANHQSYVDIPLIITKFQTPPIMKKEVLYIPIFGQLGWISGALTVSRSNMGSRRKVFEAAKRRMVTDRIGIQVYPEGTRSRTAAPKPYGEIKKTLLIFAYHEQIAVIPTSIYGTRGVLSPNGTINPGKNIGIIVHREMHPRDFASAEEFCEAAWGKVVEGYERMRQEISSRS